MNHFFKIYLFAKEIRDHKYIILHWLFISTTLSDISNVLHKNHYKIKSYS